MTVPQDSGKTSTYRVLILGGLNDVEPPKALAADRWTSNRPSRALDHLQPFVETCDSVVLNTDGPVPGLSPESSASPRQDHDETNRQADASVDFLRRMGVKGVNLANNHILQLKPQDLESELRALDQAGIVGFGAGRTIQDARVPYRLVLPSEVGGGEIHLHGFIAEGSTQFRDPPAVACSMLRLPEVPFARTALEAWDSFQVALPNWGRTDPWRTNHDYQLAHRLLSKDYDLVLGQGGATLKEVHRKLQRWVVYGIGDGLTQSTNERLVETGNDDNLPILFRSIIEVHRRGARRSLSLKLYPVYNQVVGDDSQGKPVSRESFEKLLQVLSDRPIRPWRFKNSALTADTDRLGRHLNLDLGSWPVGGRPDRLEPTAPGGDPGEWPFRGPSDDLEDRVLALDKHIGVVLLSLGADSDGGTTRWLSKNAALIEAGNKRLLARGYWGHESAVGTAVVADKVLTAHLVNKGGVLTPETRIVETADDAVRAAQEIGSEVVLKPRKGHKSQGVSTALLSEEEIRRAFDFARQYSSQVILQQHIDAADELRVMASSTQAVAAVKRLMPHVVGDGISTVRQLIDDKNLQRGLNPALGGRSIPIDALTRYELERRGLDLEYIPELREMITVRSVGGVSVGADTYQTFETLAAGVKNAAVGAVSAIPGLVWGGVDLLLERHTGRTYVIEVNAAAGYGSAVFPTYGQPRDVGAAAWGFRLAGTAAANHDSIDLPQWTDEATAVVGGQAREEVSTVLRFSVLLRESLLRLGYTFHPRGAELDWVVSPEGKGSWLRRDGMTVADRSVVVSVLKRHGWALQLLDLAKVPHTRARRVSSMESVRRFTEGRVARITLAPISASWDDDSAVTLTAREALQQSTLTEKKIIQARPSGRRFRVLASPRKAWVVTAHAEQKPSERDHIIAACHVAVDAVRAIPELRWGAVDIVVRPSAFSEGRRSGVLVEGLTLSPKYSREDQILAGDLGAFFQSLIDDTLSGEQQARNFDS